MSKYYLSNEQMIQNYGVLFQNLSKETELAKELALCGYDSEKIAFGKGLYDKAIDSYQRNKKETAEETTTSTIFRQKLEEVTKFFLSDRKKAKIIFKDQPDVLRNLSINGRASQVIANSLQQMKDLYGNLDKSEELKTAIQLLKITPEHIKAQLTRIKETESAYADYMQEKGESQQATQEKNKAFAELDKWVKELYNFAKLALEDKPQLLESIAKTTK